ncbi:hypothetical protein POM88_005395 [Heracleum sosnowskyi]|uniref:Anamorsin homolog n=1 Tax=Heracleum sosnowskyi TaxID=360622 RepID=A0AAD8J3Z2_9APIA|nr:hypothetical protein POM88_005395 [Heracleum sosnowskyi]
MLLNMLDHHKPRNNNDKVLNNKIWPPIDLQVDIDESLDHHRTCISSSAATLSNSLQNVPVDRDNTEVLKDYVVLLKVNGDAIDVNIITEWAPQLPPSKNSNPCGSLPMDAIDMIVCVSESFDSLAAKKLDEFLRVLKPGSDNFLLLKSTSGTLASSPVERKLMQANPVEEKLLKAGFQVLQYGQMKSALETELFKSIEIKARKPSTLELEDDDLIDESNLIDEEEEERQRPVHPPGMD